MIDLLSLHIPKTAGSSFLEVLRRLYSERLYVPDDSLDWDEMARRTPVHARAVHGHLMPRAFLKDYPDCRIVAWFRHPVDWVISYYHYWLGLPPHGNPDHHFLLQHRPSIVEFAEMRLMRPMPSGYLAAVAPARLGFIGSFAEFSADLHRFLVWLEHRVDPASLTMKPSVLGTEDTPWVNRTGSAQVSERVLDALRSILADEITFYEDMLRLRVSRITG